MPIGRCMAIPKLIKPIQRIDFYHGCVRRFSHSSWLASSRLETKLSAPNGIRWTQPLGLFIDNQFTESNGGDMITTVNP
ncbi:hypothetical protein V8C35DRAFT_299741 [Trichoderma chlorosporum]